MPFYEVVYETGRSSVMQCDSDDEAKEGIANHHGRAVNGEPGGPLGQPAERIAAVYVYPTHPNDYNPDQTMSADVLKSELGTLVEKAKDANGVVALDQFVFAVRGIAHPMVDDLKKPFDSRYRTKEDKKLDLKFLEGVGA